MSIRTSTIHINFSALKLFFHLYYLQILHFWTLYCSAPSISIIYTKLSINTDICIYTIQKDCKSTTLSNREGQFCLPEAWILSGMQLAEKHWGAGALVRMCNKFSPSLLTSSNGFLSFSLIFQPLVSSRLWEPDRHIKHEIFSTKFNIQSVHRDRESTESEVTYKNNCNHLKHEIECFNLCLKSIVCGQ